MHADGVDKFTGAVLAGSVSMFLMSRLMNNVGDASDVSADAFMHNIKKVSVLIFLYFNLSEKQAWIMNTAEIFC